MAGCKTFVCDCDENGERGKVAATGKKKEDGAGLAAQKKKRPLPTNNGRNPAKPKKKARGWKCGLRIDDEERKRKVGCHIVEGKK